MVADAIDQLAFRCGFWNIVTSHALYILSFDPAQDLPVDDRTKTFWVMFGIALLVSLIGLAVQLALTNRRCVSSFELLSLISLCSETLLKWISIARVGAGIPIYEIELREPSQPSEEFNAKKLTSAYSSVNNVKLEEYEFH
jgi:hypothetical protein